ncbi:calcium/sodium antiporter [Lysobacter sp. A3-1-A15]|uniref:calcium/sodium antiporter n=1 Tax=Novilysobacter viscosus TaxID=3098602 RepID=UPI002EDAE425
MEPVVLLKLVAGLALLLGGAELLVSGASRLALRWGLSPLVIGLTVVAFGTSAPELAIGIDAAVRGESDIALGNVVGSNIANVLLILGICALVSPLVVRRQLIWLDVPVMVAVSVGVLVMSLDGALVRGEGIALIVLGAAYVIGLLWLARRGDGGEDAAAAGVADANDLADVAAGAANAPAWRHALLLLAGLGLLVLGSRWLVGGAVSIAASLGISELVIGLTVVAIGTSLPEIATSVLAVIRGERDMAVGNIVGSNVFNLLFVLGATAAIAPDGVPVGAAAVRFDLPVMTAVAVACMPIFFTGHCIQRWEGGLFLGYYLAYLAYLLLDAADHDALPAFSATMMAFVVPLTVITLVVVTARAWRARHPAG